MIKHVTLTVAFPGNVQGGIPQGTTGQNTSHPYYDYLLQPK